jgi:Transglutaminase-like superfamily
MDPLTFYAKPGPMTDPGKHAPLFDNLPDGLNQLCKIVQNNMIHVFWAQRMGIKLTEAQQSTLQIRSISEKLTLITETDNQPLTTSRSLSQRQVGNCRDFTLLLVSILRHKGIAARARCGFAAYFLPNHYEDHWVAEYWNPAKKSWTMVDSQLDTFQKEALKIKFDTLNVPPDMFLTAGKAWQMCRKGKADPDTFGIMDMHGFQFIWGNVIRDFLALNKIEILPWDGGWGFLKQKLSDPLPDKETLKLYDKIATLTLENNTKFPEIRDYYKQEPRFHPPSEWGLQEEQTTR